jgi:hypothetical protein
LASGLRIRKRGSELINLAVSSSTLASIRHAAFAVALGINVAAVVVSMLTAWALMREAGAKEEIGQA